MRHGKIDKQNFFQNSQKQNTTVELGLMKIRKDNMFALFNAPSISLAFQPAHELLEKY